MLVKEVGVLNALSVGATPVFYFAIIFKTKNFRKFFCLKSLRIFAFRHTFVTPFGYGISFRNCPYFETFCPLPLHRNLFFIAYTVLGCMRR